MGTVSLRGAGVDGLCGGSDVGRTAAVRGGMELRRVRVVGSHVAAVVRNAGPGLPDAGRPEAFFSWRHAVDRCFQLLADATFSLLGLGRRGTGAGVSVADIARLGVVG